MSRSDHRGKAFVDGRESLKAVPSWTSWRVKGVASTTRAHPSHGGKAFVDSRESLKAVPSWTSRRSRIRSVKIVSGGSKCIWKGFPKVENRIRRVKVGAGRVLFRIARVFVRKRAGGHWETGAHVSIHELGCRAHAKGICSETKRDSGGKRFE